MGGVAAGTVCLCGREADQEWLSCPQHHARTPRDPSDGRNKGGAPFLFGAPPKYPLRGHRWADRTGPRVFTDGRK